MVWTASKIEKTEDIKYPESENNAVNTDEKATRLMRKSSDVLPTQEQLQHSKSSSEVIRLELERQLSLSLAAQTEQDQRIAQLTEELALKTAQLEQAEANVVEAAGRAGLEERKYVDDRRVMWTSMVKERDAELVDMQARLRDMQVKHSESLLSRDQQIGQHERELASVRDKLKAKESELDAVKLRLKDAEKVLTKSKGEADTLRAQNATGSVKRDEEQVTRRLLERVRAIEAEMVSKRWNEKSIEEMECRNESMKWVFRLNCHPGPNLTITQGWSIS